MHKAQTVDEAADKWAKDEFARNTQHVAVDSFRAGAAWAKQNDPDVVALVEAVRKMLHYQATTIFMSEPEHVTHFFAGATAALARFEKG